MTEIICSECIYFKARFQTVPLHFIDPRVENLGVEMEALTNLLCCHDDCFEEKRRKTPEAGTFKYKVRIAGQAQFNANNDCHRFKPSFLTKVINGINWCFK